MKKDSNLGNLGPKHRKARWIKGWKVWKFFTSREEQICLNSIWFRVPGSVERAKTIKWLHPEWYLSLLLWHAVTLGNLLHPADLCFSRQYNDSQFLTVSYSGMLKVDWFWISNPPIYRPLLLFFFFPAPELWLLTFKYKQLSQMGNMIEATLMAKELGAKNLALTLKQRL